MRRQRRVNAWEVTPARWQVRVLPQTRQPVLRAVLLHKRACAPRVEGVVGREKVGSARQRSASVPAGGARCHAEKVVGAEGEVSRSSQRGEETGGQATRPAL